MELRKKEDERNPNQTKKKDLKTSPSNLTKLYQEEKNILVKHDSQRECRDESDIRCVKIHNVKVKVSQFIY